MNVGWARPLEYSEPMNNAPSTMRTTAATSTPTSAASTTVVGARSAIAVPWVIGRLTANSSAITTAVTRAVTARPGNVRTDQNFVCSARSAARGPGPVGWAARVVVIPGAPFVRSARRHRR